MNTHKAMNRNVRTAQRILSVFFLVMILYVKAAGQQQDIIIKLIDTYDFTGYDSVLNNRAITIFDADSNIISEMGYLGQSKNTKKVYKYDLQGRLIKLSTYSYNSAYDAFWPVRLENFSYDTYGYENKYVSYMWFGKQMVPQDMWIMGNNPDGNRTLLERYTWHTDLNDWLPYDKTESLYNEEGYMTLDINYLWDADSSKWIFDHKNELSYNAAGRNVQFTSSKWDTTSGQWVYDMRIDSTFNDKDNIVTTLFSTWDVDSSAWRPFREYRFKYDSFGYTSRKTTFIWDAVDSLWNAYKKEGFTNDSTGNILYHAKYLWNADSTNWQKLSYENQEYDNNGMIVLKDSFELVLYENRWRGYKHTYAYDDNRLLVLFQTYTWNSSDSTFTDYERIRYAYDESGRIKAKLTDRYKNWDPINDYMPYEHIYYNISPGKMDKRNTCEGDSVLWYDNYYTEGIYMAEILSTEGTDSTVYLSVTESSHPAVFQITGDTSVNLTEVFLYKAFPDSGNNYEWTVENGSILSGQGQDSILVQWDSTGTGSVKVWSTLGGGCTSDTASLTVEIYLTGISNPTQKDLYIFPNPAHDQLQIKNLSEACDYRIIDLSGRILQTGKIPIDGSIHITLLPPGLYYLNLIHDQKCILNEKFMKH